MRMPIPNMFRYFSNILLLWTLCCVPAFAQEADDSTIAPQPSMPKVHQLRVGIDITQPIINAALDNREAYEFQLDYYFKKELYIVAEGGWGNAAVDYPDLAYTSSNAFARVGIDKSLLPRLLPGDWDMVFIGLRYGIAPISRSAATYTTNDAFWGVTTGTIPGKNFTAHWAEITGGLRLELFKGLFVGYNIRGRFLLNQKPFQELPPSFVAGYGKGDKNSIFDYNFYVTYAIRWQRGGNAPAK